MPEPMTVYELCDYDYRTLDSVKMIRGLGASTRNAREYFKRKGWKGKFILYDTHRNKGVRVMFSPVPPMWMYR